MMIFDFLSPAWQDKGAPCPDTLKDIKQVKVCQFFEEFNCRDLSADELGMFVKFLRKGRRSTMLKCMTFYSLEIRHSTGVDQYCVHGHSIGPEPGGLRQVIFRPKQKGLHRFLDGLFLQ